MTINTSCPAETEALGQKLALQLCPGDVLALFGGLGAGKTTFVRGLASGLGVKTPVSSPTYTIVNEYEGEIPLFHFDMYRLTSADDLFDIGWDDYLQRSGVIAVEWSENVPEAFGEDTIRITFDAKDRDRTITVQAPENRGITL